MDNVQTDSLLLAKLYWYLEDCAQQVWLEKFVFVFFFYTRETSNYAVRAVEQIDEQY